MSDVAFIRYPPQWNEQDIEHFLNAFEDVEEDAGTRFLLVPDSIEAMSEREAKEALGKLVAVLDYELDG